MAGYPYDTGSSFIRYPSYYKHDAFGHIGADDPKLGLPVCVRKIPHTGIDISPKKKGDINAKVVSPVYGTIIATGFDKEAGNWHMIKAYGLAEWWFGGHHDRFVKRSGNVERGEHIAYMGATGGAHGAHVHWSVATSEAAAWDLVNGYVNYKNGRSSTAWGASEGLVDPWPLFEREWAAHEKHLEDVKRAEAAYLEARARAEAEAKARQEEEEMSAAADDIKNVIRRENRIRVREHAVTGEIMLESIKSGYIETFHPKDRPNWVDDLTRNNEAIVTLLEVGNRPKIDDAQWKLIQELANKQLDRIGKAAAKYTS